MDRPDEVAVQNNSAAYYEKRYSGWGLKYHKSVIDWMMEEVWPDYQVLDAGCGTGIISRLYPNHFICGIDLSSEMISKCPKKSVSWCDAEGRIYSTWVSQHMVADVTEKHRAYDGSADAVVCRSLLHHLPDHKKALREFHRVLKPGGKFVAWETNKSWLAQKVRERTQHGDRFSEQHHAFRPGEIERDLADAGFRVTEVSYMGFLAYPIFGFPDILPLANYVPFKKLLFPCLMALDEVLSWIPGVRKMAWAVGIKAVKV